MRDIRSIPEHELRSDLNDSYGDLMSCESALKLGINDVSGSSAQERLDANKGFIVKIKAELVRREALGDE